jgi:uncharacterized protein
MTSNKPTPYPIVIFVTGPFSSGKTRLIQTISEIEVVSAEINGIEAALDFGRIEISPTEVIYFFGTPGARRFEAEWVGQLSQYFKTTHLGAIVLTKAARPESFRETKAVIEYVRKSEAPYLVAANLRENAEISLTEQYKFIGAMPQYFSENTIKICNATQKASVKAMVVELLKLLPSDPLMERAITKVQSL